MTKPKTTKLLENVGLLEERRRYGQSFVVQFIKKSASFLRVFALKYKFTEPMLNLRTKLFNMTYREFYSLPEYIIKFLSQYVKH